MKSLSMLALATAAAAFWAASCPAAGESISFNGYRDSNGEITIDGAGVLEIPASAWNNVTASGVPSEVKLLSSDKATTSTITLATSTHINGIWYLASTWTSAKDSVTKTTGNGQLFFNYMDSYSAGWGNGNGWVSLSDIPFTEYTLYLYPGSEGDGSDTYGTMSAFKVTAGESTQLIKGDGASATVTTSDLTDSWGTNQSFREENSVAPVLTEGVNYLKLTGLSGNLKIEYPEWSGSRRAGLAGFQIVNTGDLITGSSFTASPSGTDVTFKDIVWNEEGGLVQGAANSTEVTLAAGATLRVTEEVTLGTLKVISTGDVTIVGTEAALAKVLKIDATEVTGTATLAYTNTSATPAIPTLAGIDVFKKQSTANFAPTANAPFAGVQIIAEAGTSTFSLDLTGMKATAEKPFTVTGENTAANFQGSGYNKAPAGGTLKATNGATLGITGTNPFSSSDPVAILVDSANLAITHNSGNHVKAGQVTLSNSSAITIAGTANAYASEGFVLLGESNKLVAESGENTVTYGETDTARNRLRIQSGTIEVKDGATLTVGVELASGSGEGTTGANSTITKTGAGLLKLVDAATPGTVNALEGTLDIGGHRPTIATLGESSQLVVAPTATEIAAGSITLNITEGTLSESNVTVTGATINAVSGTTITFTMTVPELTTSGAWSTASWSTGSLPTSAAKLIGGATPESAITVTLDTDLSALSTLVVSGYVTLVTTEAQAIIPACVDLVSGANLTVSAPFSGPLTVPTGTTVTMNGITMASALTVNGTLKTSGTASLTGGNTVAEGATVEVLDGTTTFGLSGTQAFKGTLKVASGATFKNGTADGPDYGGKAQFEIYGTLEVMGQTRWSLNTGSVIRLYDGAELKGEGDTVIHATFDFYNGGKVTTEGTVAINAPFAVHTGGGKALEIETAEGSVVTMSKAISPTLGANASGTVNFKKSGKGQLTMTANSTLVGTNTVAEGTLILESANGGSSASWIIDPGATLESTGSFTVPFSKGAGVKITNNGTLRVASVDGQIPPTEGSGDVVIGANCRLAGPLTTTGTLTVPSDYTLELSKNSADTFDGTPSINGPSVVCAGSITNGTVTIASGMSLSGTGTISVPVTFEDGAVVDARSETGTVYVTLSGAVTLPGTGTVKVKANNYGAVLGAAGLTAEKFAMTEGGSLSEGVFTLVGDYLYLVQKPTVPSGTDSAAAEAIARAALESGAFFTQVTEATAAPGCQVDGAALFNEVVTFSAVGTSLTEATALVQYDFGVSDLRVSALSEAVADGALAAGTQYVLVCATVSNQSDLAQNTADYATGTVLTLFNDGTELTSDVVKAPTAAEVSALGLSTPNGSRWLAVPLSTFFPTEGATGTIKLTVKASK
ncbi:MAG: beta strand repeat-containing protein [Candidatus Spyradenecus sp.]